MELQLPQINVSIRSKIMEIRLIKPSDTQKFVDFYEKLARETDYLMFTPEEVSEKAAEEEKFIRNYNDYKQVFIAVEDDNIVGYLGVSRSRLSKTAQTAKFTIGVLNDCKQQGIATQLIEFAENWAKEKGIRRLELTVVTENKPAVSLFEKTGFEKEGTRKNAVRINGEFYDEYFMAKAI